MMQENSITFNDSELHAVLINHTRYCLTRRSYAASECCDLLRSKWAQIPVNTQVIIRRDIKEALDYDDKQIEEERSMYEQNGVALRFYSLDKCDRLSWDSILQFISKS